MMIFLFGIIATVCVASVVLNIALFHLARNLRNKEKEMMQDLNAYANMEQSIIKEKQFIKEKHDAIVMEKDRQNAELKQSFANQIRDLKQEMEKRILDERNNHEKMKESFSNIANNILEQKGKNLQDQSLHNIKHILEPFKGEIQGFKEIILNSSTKNTEQITSLKTQISLMQEQEKKLMLTAENLTKALTAENKTQGNWGEMILRRILESCGLKKGVHFIEQGTGLNLENSDGDKQKPDFIINLPNNKHIVIDAKTSLTAYERFCTTNQKEDLDAFLFSIKTHIKQLASKEYQRNFNSPDFTIMFIPIEGAYFLAVQNDRSLWEFAWERKIAICCPSNMFPMLKTVENLWANDAINKNAQTIASRAMDIYSKFNGFVENFETIGKSLGKAQEVYQNAHKQFISGRGSLDSQFKQMQGLMKNQTDVQELIG